jgi:hypothetical protein
VSREEARLARDRAAHARIKQAWAAHRRPPGAPLAAAAAASQRGARGVPLWDAWAAAGDGGGGGACGGPGLRGGGAARSSAAAAAALGGAVRELRPAELVGLYERQREALEQELAAASAEVRARVCMCVCVCVLRAGMSACWVGGQGRHGLLAASTQTTRHHCAAVLCVRLCAHPCAAQVRVLSGQLRDAQNLLIARDRAAAAAAAAAGLQGKRVCDGGAAASLGDPAAEAAAAAAAAARAAELQRALGR